MFGFEIIDWIALAWFVVAWVFYHQLVRRGIKRQRLQTALQSYVRRWAYNAARREVKIVDTQIIGNLERNGAFLASSSLVIIAGILAVAASSEQLVVILSALTTIKPKSAAALDLILFLMGLSFVYAFFTFTWCIRQYGMASIMIGALPQDGTEAELKEAEPRIEAFAAMVGLAIHSFVQGLRAYYFSLALLAWLIHPLAFMFATAWVVAVLYRRDYQSRSFKTLLPGLEPEV